jgi:mevalonate kinase
MSFELANASITFQSYINFALKEFLDVFVVIYLNDILIYSQNEEKHTYHVRFVLKRFKKYKLFAKLNKYDFDLKEIDYLKFIVEINDIRMNFARIAIVKKWVESTIRRHVRTFLKFVEFYRRFIEKFNKIVKSLTNLFKEKKKRSLTKNLNSLKKRESHSHN